MAPTFRLATTDDSATLIALMRQFYAIDNYPFAEEAARAALTPLVQQGEQGRLWLILFADTIVGSYIRDVLRWR